MTHAGLTSTACWLMLLLGARINPGMGWLFAVALGMQEQKGSAVARALVPIALGHALAIGIVGLALLRNTWFNFNLVWGAALVASGLFTLLM